MPTYPGLPAYLQRNGRLLRKFLLSSALMLLVSGCNQPANQGSAEQEVFKSTDVAGAIFARDFHLTDHHGQPRTLSDFKGQIVVLFFGYIHCPDICPNTLSKLAEVMQRLGANADKVQVLFATLDPERDTQQILAQFVPTFHPKFIGLYGTQKQTGEVAEEYKITYRKQPGKLKGSYTIDHSAGTYIYDGTGKLRLYASYSQGVDDLVEDIKVLLKTASH